MSGYSLDANILIDALLGHEPAHREMKRIAGSGPRMWISRMAWIEVLSKGSEAMVRDALDFVGRFGIDEVDDETSRRAAALRREDPGVPLEHALQATDAPVRAAALRAAGEQPGALQRR